MDATIGPMILERSMNDQFLSNTYVVADADGGTAVMIDAGGPVGPLLEAIDSRGLALTHVLLTHHHYDHVCELGQVTERHPEAQVLGHAAEEVEGKTGTIAPGDVVEAGDLRLEAVHTPGHTAGGRSLLVAGGGVTRGPPVQGSGGGGPAPGPTPG